jgi:hypothetical protein
MIFYAAFYLAVVMMLFAGFVGRMTLRLRDVLHPQSRRAALALCFGCLMTSGAMVTVAMVSHG